MTTDLAARVTTALVGIPALILLVGLGRAWHFSLLILLATTVALWEYYRMAFPGHWKEQTLGILLGVEVALGMIAPVDLRLFLAAVLTTAALVIYLPCAGKLKAWYPYWGWTFIGTFYIGYFFPHFVLLYQSLDGRGWVFWILLVVMAGDTAGYFVGSCLGRRKLAPKISPNKTVEGALGSTTGAVLAGLFGSGFLLPAMSGLEAVFLSLILALLGQAGDLFESWIKRVFGVKNSGVVLPGHGGILDRMDSLVFPAVFTTYYIRWVH